MKNGKTKLYVEEVYTTDNSSHTTLLIETTGLFQNEIIEEFISSQGIILTGNENDRSFLRISIPCNRETIKLKPEKWYNFPLDFFQSTTEYRFLTEDDAGSNLIRACLYLKEYPEELAPKRATQPPKVDDFFITGEILRKLLENHKYDEISSATDYILKVLVLRGLDNSNLILNKKQTNSIKNIKTVNKAIDHIIKKSEEATTDTVTTYIDSEQTTKELIDTIKNTPTPLEQFFPIPDNQDKITLEVVNCGHGNWNEIHTETSCFFYDIGATLHQSQAEINNFAPNRFGQPMKRGATGENASSKNNILIISHWDKDHYQTILNIEKNDLQQVNCCLAPTPKEEKLAQNTIKKALLRLNNIIGTARIHLYDSQSESGHTTAVTTNLLQLSHNITLHMGRAHKDHNQSGLILQIEGKERQALLPADHHWHQISSLGTLTNKPLIVVTPHHGGKAGSFRRGLNRLMQTCSSLDLCTSCDEKKNSYKHPRQELTQHIQSLGLNHQRTDHSTNALGNALVYTL